MTNLHDVESDPATRTGGSWLYRSPVHDEALARLAYVVENRLPCGVLSGPAGTGKTRVLSVLVRSLRRSGTVVAHVDAAGLDAAELASALCDALGVVVSGHPRMALREFLSAQRALDASMTLVVDHLERATPEAEAFLANLLVRTTGPEAEGSRETLLVACRPAEGFRDAAWWQGRSALRIDLEPLDWRHTAEFALECCTRCGGEPFAFDEDALTAVYELTAGIPRRIEQLVRACLAAGRATATDRIDRRTVESVSLEVGPVTARTSRPRATPAPARC